MTAGKITLSRSRLLFFNHSSTLVISGILKIKKITKPNKHCHKRIMYLFLIINMSNILLEKVLNKNEHFKQELALVLLKSQSPKHKLNTKIIE